MDQPWWGSRESLALSISEAARICGVKRRMIRRRHHAGEFDHAFKDPDGTWRIPVNDLVAAGFRPNVVTDPDEPRIVFTAASQADRLRTEVAVLRERVRALEIIAREREERVTDLRTILRMLPAPKEADEVPPPRAEEPPAPVSQTDDEQPGEKVIREPVSAEVRGAMIRDPAEVTSRAAMPRPVRVTAPFDAPASPAASSEPIVILPDVPSEEAEPPEGGLERTAELLETARQRSAELLEDAMSLWWPSPTPTTQPESAPWSSGRYDPAAATPSASEPAQASTTVSDKAVASATLTDETAAAPSAERAQPPPGPQPAAPRESDLFTPNQIDEASFDWLDPDFGRPARHLRRRLGRFFRRHRRPR